MIQETQENIQHTQQQIVQRVDDLTMIVQQWKSYYEKSGSVQESMTSTTLRANISGLHIRPTLSPSIYMFAIMASTSIDKVLHNFISHALKPTRKTISSERESIVSTISTTLSKIIPSHPSFVWGQGVSRYLSLWLSFCHHIYTIWLLFLVFFVCFLFIIIMLIVFIFYFLLFSTTLIISFFLVMGAKKQCFVGTFLFISLHFLN